MNSEIQSQTIDTLIDEYSKKHKRKEKFLVLEEYIDPGIYRKPPEYIFEIKPYTAEEERIDCLAEDLEILKVGAKVKFFTKSSDPEDKYLYKTMTGSEIVKRLRTVQRKLVRGIFQPPGELRGIGEHHKLKIKEHEITITAPEIKSELLVSSPHTKSKRIKFEHKKKHKPKGRGRKKSKSKKK